MSWWNFIPGIFRGAKDLSEVFVENKENKGQRGHVERITDMELSKSVLDQFAAEFHARQNRSKWDSFVDGLNRLPRPLMTFSVLGFFVLAPLAPERFMLIAASYEMVPPGYWALLSVIVGFYFGGRMQLKKADMSLRVDQVKAAKELVAMREEFRAMDVEEEKNTELEFQNALRAGESMVKNRIVAKWLAKKG